jgi:hypothetical protein
LETGTGARRLEVDSVVAGAQSCTSFIRGAADRRIAIDVGVADHVLGRPQRGFELGAAAAGEHQLEPGRRHLAGNRAGLGRRRHDDDPGGHAVSSIPCAS